jgi:hypothetical protein
MERVRKKQKISSLTTQSENVIGEPIPDGTIQLAEFACKEVVCSLHNDKLIFTRQGCHEFFDVVNRAVFVIAPVHKELRFVAAGQKRKIGGVDRNA